MNTFSKAVSLAVGISILGLPAMAQPDKAFARLHGMVQASAQAVEGAQIEIKGLGPTVTTGASGSYRIDQIKPGRYWVMVQRVGLTPMRAAITLRPAEDRELRFELEPVPRKVSQQLASEQDSLYRDFTRRIESSFESYFLTRDDIEGSRQSMLHEVLAYHMIPLSPLSGSRYTTTGCTPFVSVNGARPLRGRSLSEFRPQEVEAVEVYRGSAPLFGFTPTASQCGLIILWTQ